MTNLAVCLGTLLSIASVAFGCQSTTAGDTIRTSSVVTTSAFRYSIQCKDTATGVVSCVEIRNSTEACPSSAYTQYNSPAKFTSQSECVKQLPNVPICTTACQNGGTCTGSNTCACRDGWSGTQCTTPTCNPSCTSPQVCSLPNTCTCPLGSYGDACASNYSCTPSCTTGYYCAGTNMCMIKPTANASTCGKSKYFNVPAAGSGISYGNTAMEGQFPWVVRMSYNISNTFRCNAVIVHERFLLTAAWCVPTRSTVTLTFGDWRIGTVDNYEFTVTPEAYYIHPSYSDATLAGAFALIKLPEANKLDFTANWNVQKICLATSADECTGPFTMAGWGKINETTYPSTMQYNTMNFVPSSVCQNNWASLNLSSWVSDNNFCSGTLGGSAAIEDDTGAPIMAVQSGAYKLCGVMAVTAYDSSTSYGVTYTLSPKLWTYSSWINSKIEEALRV